MLRKKSKAIPEGNGPTPQDAFVMITREELRRVLSESIGNFFREFKGDFRRIDQRVASLEQDAQQPRLPVEAGVTADMKNRECTEGAAAEVQAENGESCSTKRIQASPTSSTNFGVKAEPPASLAEMTSWSRTVLRRQSRVSHPWRWAHQQPPVAFSPPAKLLQRRGLHFTSRVFGSAQPRRRILRGCQLNTPRTTAVSGG